jgi:hypothetical protein
MCTFVEAATTRTEPSAAFKEVLADAAATGAGLHVVHIQSTSGPNVIYELDMIRGARARGLDVTTEAYPYDRGMTGIQSALYDNREKGTRQLFFYLALASNRGKPDTRNFPTLSQDRWLGDSALDDAGIGARCYTRPVDIDRQRRNFGRRTRPPPYRRYFRAYPCAICARGEGATIVGCAPQDDANAGPKA